MRSFLGALAILLFVAAIGCDKKGSLPNAQKSDTPQVAATPTPEKSQGPILLSKDSTFWEYRWKDLQKGFGEPFLAKYSRTWASKLQEIDSQIAAISEPSLREAKGSKLWAMVDKAACQEEAEAAYKVANQAYQSARTAFFAKHSQDWYELGHYLTYRTQEERIVIEGTKANLLEQREFQVPLSIQDMDRLFSKFKSVELNTIASKANGEWNRAVALGGDPVSYYTDRGLSVAEAKEMIAKEQGRIWNRFEEEARSTGLLLVGQMDSKSGKIIRLAFMSYNTQEVLMDLPGEVVAVVVSGSDGAH